MYRWSNFDRTIVQRLTDGAFIAAEETNPHFAAVLAWEKEGNTIEAFVPDPLMADGARRAAAREKFFDELLTGTKSIDAIRTELKADLARGELLAQEGTKRG